MTKFAPALLLTAIGALAATSAQATPIHVKIKNETALNSGPRVNTINPTYCNKSDISTDPCPTLPSVTDTWGTPSTVDYSYPTLAPGTSYAQRDVWASYQVVGGGTCNFFFRLSRNSLGSWGFNNGWSQASTASGHTPICLWDAGPVNTSTGEITLTFTFAK